MGSVKDLRIIREANEGEEGEGVFLFSDRFSVFDWGVMPDLIDGKGKSICVIGAWFFERLEELGIKTHYIGVLEDGRAKTLSDVREPPSEMAIRLLRVMKPKLTDGVYDYSEFKRQKGNFVIPLEVIYRNSLPAGSSVFRRLKEGQLSLDELGLSEFPQENTKLEKTFVDFSTKFENQDRYVSQMEAKEISGLTEGEFERIKELTLLASKLITESVQPLGISNDDGKFEFGLDGKRQVIFVDVIGTPDECRFTWQGVQISKEVLRKHYRKTTWYERVQEAKKSDPIGWKELVASEPPHLPQELKRLVSEMYMSLCNFMTQREWFRVRDLPSVVREIKELLS